MTPRSSTDTLQGVSPRVPSFFLLIPGPWESSEQIVRLLLDAGVPAEHELAAGAVRVELICDHGLGEAFKWGRFGALPPDVVTQVRSCNRAALLEVGLRFDRAGPLLKRLSLPLRQAGGIAIRVEASGGAWPWEPWLERLEANTAWALYECATIVVADEDGTVFTCGMHAFDLPDAQIQMSDTRAAIEWLDTFCVYQIDEQPALASGHTFRPDADSTRRTLERWPDDRHRPQDGRHNPFGVWRFLAEGLKGLTPTEPVPTFVPPLVVLLTRAEEAAGRPLTQTEVERLREKGTCVAMELADAIGLERVRGYADIEPDLAWEQWQVVRSGS